MRCLVKRLAAFSVLFLLLFAAVESRAQEVLPIRSGVISHSGNQAISPFTSHSFYLAGDGIAAASSEEKGASVGMSCNPCAPGETLKLNVTLSRFVTSAHGRATVSALSYYPVWYLGSEFKLAIAPVKIPEGNAPYGLTARFTMSGRLVGYPFPSPLALFDRQVEGQGVVRIYLIKSPFPDRPGYMFQSASYKFEARRAQNRKESAQPSRPSPVERQQ